MKILSGPMLRRLESNCAYIWLVIQGEFDVASLSAQTWLGSEQLSGDCECTVIKLSESLHAVMVCLKAPASGWPEADSVGYDLCYEQQSVFQPAYFEGPLPLYHGETYPSFRYYPRITQMMSASCRKPHGAKQDALAAYDRKIEQSGPLNKLPDVLFLTGDQIYADDVDPQVAQLIYQYSAELFPDEALAEQGQNRLSLDSIGWRNRNLLLNKKNGFYTTAGEYHLLGFREYLSMYLLAWGGLCHDLPEPVIPMPTKHNKGELSKRQIDQDRAVWRSYNKARNFVGQSWRVRRLLAHVPSYMMCDDHEVTDDWNLSAQIQAQLSAPGTLGQQVVTNALTAFALCQAWGNAPEQYHELITQTLPAFIGGLTEYNAQRYQDTSKKLTTLNFTVLSATQPPALILDTRTQRAFRPGKPFAPLLMNDAALSQVKALLATLEPNTQELVVVSPAPVFGFTELEQLQLGAVSMLKHQGATRFDGECWISDAAQMQALTDNLLTLPALSHCYLLSGDVHYGYCRSHKKSHPANSHSVDFWQLTSSSVSNAPTGILETSLKMLHQGTVLGLSINPFKRKNTQYLKPVNWQGKFLSGHLNLGWLNLTDKRYTMSILRPNGKWSDWQYDLTKPNLLE
ncbi:hypothetical protein C3B51_07700 [Pseudoalteromonas rubra]|uniref:PhoD-like phosphatase metallophosphatase domain-containing protein n=1 Tax=Pseudoalteromonas rubra TaxID=43658 RepID=A0A4Q7EIF5_9GAMM|nr:hypothetical protein [Pseudoalteromonas rubra]RZM83185.1 hypothetical protein C3B51_07700 [Pseudoalteromonas rubra]